MPYSTWRDDSGDEWQPVLSRNSSPLEPARLVPAARTLVRLRKTNPPKPQNWAMHSPSHFCGSNCLSNRSQLRTAVGRTETRVIAGHLQEGPREPALRFPLAGRNRAKPAKAAPRQPAEAQHKGIGRSLIKSALFFLGVLIGYFLIHFIPHLHSLTKAENGRWGTERNRSKQLVNNVPFPQSS